MRRQQHVIAPEQGMMPEIRRVVGQHVEGRAAQEPLVERQGEVRFMDERAARDIDEQRLPRHVRERPAIEKAPAAGVEIAVQRDDVRARKKLVEVDRLRAVAADLRGVDARVRG